MQNAECRMTVKVILRSKATKNPPLGGFFDSSTSLRMTRGNEECRMQSAECRMAVKFIQSFSIIHYALCIQKFKGIIPSRVWDIINFLFKHCFIVKKN